jgi:hypothetical protein
MKILITAPNVFTGDNLKIGCYYNVELAAEGTDAQNKTFHALLQCYWTSGCHSYNARSYEHFRALIKLYLGAGTEKYWSLVNEDGTKCPNGRVAYRLKSWSDYTKKERQMTIDNLISEMLQAGMNDKYFEEILQGMEEQSIKRQKENNP